MADLLSRSGNRVHATSPNAWEQAMRPAVGDVRVREVLGRQFSADLKLFDLGRTGLFSIKIDSSRIALPEGSGFVSVNLIKRGQINTTAPKRGGHWLPGMAYAVNHEERPFDFTCSNEFEALTVCFRDPMLQSYARKFHGPNSESRKLVDASVSLESDISACFSRYLSFVWDELNQGGAFLQSSIATEEIEDSLCALFLSAVDDGSPRHDQSEDGYAIYIRRAEEYVYGHLDSALRVADIAGAAGVSVTTLNRAFRKHYGMGPKAFVKQRRLDRVRCELLAADPQSNSVTAIAMTFGFYHMGQFAADYKRVFHEAPSTTLRQK